MSSQFAGRDTIAKPTRTITPYHHSLSDVAMAEVHFDDGSIRTAWETADGLQYVEDDNGERVYGVWFIPEDCPRPIIVDIVPPEDF